jgi:hypothetical protein
MIKHVLALGILTVSISAASAGCSTIGSYTSCSDGNTYTTIGNSTFGSNSRTGSTWSQTTIGGNTFGIDSSGNTWSNSIWD